MYFAGLDQFGPHSRIIGPWHVQSDYNFIRGGDICELSIWDHMLTDEEIQTLASGELPQVDAFRLDPTERKVQEGWRMRSGLNQKLPKLPVEAAARKVEIHDTLRDGGLREWTEFVRPLGPVCIIVPD